MKRWSFVVLFLFVGLSGCSSTARQSDEAGDKGAPIIEVEPMVVPPLSPSKSTFFRKDDNPAVVALLGKAEQAKNEGDVTSAVAHIERALRIDPRSPSAYYQLASLKLQQDKAHEALQLAQKALHFEPNSSSLLVKLWELVAVCKDLLGDVIGAVQARERVKQLR